MPRAHIIDVPRERDEQILHWLHLRVNCGMKPAEIARREGIPAHRVKDSLKPIMPYLEDDQ